MKRLLSDSASYNFYKLAVLRTPLYELYNAVALCKQGMVFATTNILAGMETGATLPYQNITGQYGLTTIALHAKSFRF